MEYQGKEIGVPHSVRKGAEIMRIILMILTSIYVVLIAWQDLKEREVYTFPCTILTALWFVENMYLKTESWGLFLIYVIICFGLAKAFAVKHIWGAGDSDLFFLFTMIYQSYSMGVGRIESICIEVVLFAVAMILALVIGWIEGKIKKEKLDKSSSIAVAPGFAIVVFILMWKGVSGC